MIPKLIHQTWKSSTVTPPFRPEWPASWKEVNPGWQYRLWSDHEIDEFVRRNHPSFHAAFASYDIHIKRVDAWRCLLLQTVGGIYADLDTMCLRPVEEWCHGAGLIMGARPHQSKPSRQIDLSNAVMASAPGHPFWEGIQRDLVQGRMKGVVQATGPDFITERMRRYLNEETVPPDIAILPSVSFYPVAWNSPDKREIAGLSGRQLRTRYPESSVVNFWTGTWLESPQTPG